MKNFSLKKFYKGQKFTNKNPLLTLSEYRKIAHSIIYSLGHTHLINNEDVITNMITKMAMADDQYDPDHPSKAKQQVYRYDYAVSAIKDFITELKDIRNQNSHLGGFREEPQYTWMSIQNNSDISLATKDLLNCPFLTKTEKKCIIMYYLESHSLQEVGNHFRFSKTRARFLINRGLQKIRKYANV